MQKIYAGSNEIWSKALVMPAEYGLLYSFAVCEDPRNIAPPGWHIASWDEIMWNLRVFINSPDGSAYKEAGLDHWNSPNNGSDIYGLKILGSGFRGSTACNGLKDNFQCWTSTHDLWSPSVYSGMFWSVAGNAGDIYGNYNMIRGSYCPGSNGMAIRFVKDDSTDPGSMTDNDGNIYPTVKINNLVFTSVNHTGIKFRNGDSVPIVNTNTTWLGITTPVCCRYEPYTL